MRSRTHAQALAALTLAALLLGAPPAPPPPPPPPPPPADPFEPMIFGVFKLKVKGYGKDVANEAFEADGQFPTLYLETEEGYAIPVEVVIDPFQDKMVVDFEAMAVPILEGWLADRVQDLTGGVPVVTLTKAPKVKFKDDTDLGMVIKFKFKGTVQVDGETRKFRYKGAFATLMGA